MNRWPLAGTERGVYPWKMGSGGHGEPNSGSSDLPQDLFERALGSIPAVTYVARGGDTDEPPIWIAPQCEEVLGIAREAFSLGARGRNALIHPDDRERVWNAARELEAVGGRWDETYRLVLPDGSDRSIHDQARVVSGDDGASTWYGVLTGLSSGTDTATPVSEADQRYRVLVDQLPAIVYIDTHGPHPVTLFVSEQTERITGYRPEEYIADPDLFLRSVHPDDLPGMSESWALEHEAEGGATWEYRFFRRDGQEVWLWDTTRLIRSGAGTPLLWQGVIVDITAQKRVEQALAGSEAKFEKLVEQLPGYVFVAADDADTTQLYTSPQVLELTGYTPEEFTEDPEIWPASIHPDDRERVADEWRSAVEQRSAFVAEYRLIHRDGGERWFRDTARLARASEDGELFWVGIALDITESKRAELELRASETRFRLLIEQVPAVVYIDSNEIDFTCLYMSPGSTEMLGRAPQEYMADPSLWPRDTHPEDRERVQRRWEASVRSGQPFHDEYRYVRPDGSTLWIADDSRLVRGPDGSPLYWQGVVTDATESRRAAEEIRESVARYRSLVEQLSAVVFIDTNEESPARLYVSPQADGMFGRRPEEFVEDAELWVRSIHPEDRDRVVERWIRSVRTGQPFDDDFRIVRPDGELVWVRQEALLVRNAEGVPTYWQGLIHDISAHKEIENILRASEARYRALVEQVPAVVYEMGPDDVRRTLYVSRHVEAILGYSRREWLDQPDIWVELLHPDDREIILAHLDEHNETREPWSEEYRLIASDGRVVWVHDTGVLVRDQEGVPPTWHGVILDVTTQKALEERLRYANEQLEQRVRDRTAELAEANEMMALEIGERTRADRELKETRSRYRQLVENIPAVVYAWRLDPSIGNVEYVSPQIQTVMGYSPAEFAGPTVWLERLHPHDREATIAAAKRCMDTGEPFESEYRLFAKDGRVVWVLDQSTLLSRDEAGRPAVYQGVLLDITARKDAEAKAAAAEARLESIAVGPVAFYEFDVGAAPERKIDLRYSSPELGRLVGVSKDELERDPAAWLGNIHPDDREAVVSELQEQLATGSKSERSYRVIDRDGRVRWVRAESRCVARDDRGRPSRFQGVLIDISREKEAEQRLRDEAADLRSYVEEIPAIPWIELVEGEPGTGRVTYIGPQVEQILGWTAEELLAQPGPIDNLIHPEDRARILALSAHHDRTGQRWSAEYRMMARSGDVVWIRSEAVSRRDDQGRLVWYGLKYDITGEHPAEPLTVPEADTAGAETEP